jgi:hypothetical protein
MEINSGHERPFARLGQAELAREDGRQGRDFGCVYLRILPQQLL